jgi:hypothetical protein
MHMCVVHVSCTFIIVYIIFYLQLQLILAFFILRFYVFSSLILVTNTITCLFDLLQMCVPCTAIIFVVTSMCLKLIIRFTVVC